MSWRSLSVRVVLLNELLPATRRSQRPQWDAVALIVEMGVDVGGKDFNGKTLLKRIIQEGAWDVVKLAIERTGCRRRARSRGTTTTAACSSSRRCEGAAISWLCCSTGARL